MLSCYNLMDRGITLVDGCCMCRRSGETMDNLLLHCDIAYAVWTFVFSAFGVQWVMLRSVVDHLSGQRNWFRKHFSSVWNLVPLCIWWTLWRDCTFEDEEALQVKFNSSFPRSLFDWSWVLGLGDTHSFVDSLVLSHLDCNSHSL